MSTQFTRYTSYNQYVHDGTINLNNTGKVMLALVTSEYVFSAAHTIFDNGADDATDPSHCEVATGDGYTTGGAALASLSVNTTRFDSADVTWTGLTKTFRGAVLFINDTVGGVAKPLIGYVLFDSTPADISITGGDFTCQVAAAGWISYT